VSVVWGGIRIRGRFLIIKGCGTLMSKEVNRRAFLKASAVTGTLFLAGDLLYGNPKVHGVVNIPEADKITVTMITDNYCETTRPSYKIANRYIGGYRQGDARSVYPQYCGNKIYLHFLNEADSLD